MSKPLLLDLFCGAGGCSMGYHRAGFRVVGVDNKPQKNYPFQFIQMDALSFLMQYGRRFDVIHASPPCQAFTWSTRIKYRDPESKDRIYFDLLNPSRWILQSIGTPYIIENVVGAPMKNPIILCGTQFGLRVFRHRQFESNIPIKAPRKCSHKGNRIGFGKHDFVTVAGHGGNGSSRFGNWCDAMDIDWMTKKELTQAIPPDYTQYIGEQIIDLLNMQQ